MGPHVIDLVAGYRECLATTLKGAFEGFFPCMGPHVNNQVAGTGEYFLTIRPGTLVFLSPRTLVFLNLRRTLHAVLSVLYFILWFISIHFLLKSGVRITPEFNKRDQK